MAYWRFPNMRGCKMVETSQYWGLERKYLTKSVEEIPRSEVVELHQKRENCVEKLSRSLLKGEGAFLWEGLNSKEIPQPQLLVKDHKDPDEAGFFPTRLVIPTTNFIATFSKIGYLGIKKALDENNVSCSKYTIVQSSDLKSRLEQLRLKQKDI
eukprot:12062905-Ditylum_brightwellii.AAC.1